jgi:hypothetical protein
MRKKLNKNKGLTLIEALIWFAIFAAVIYSAFVMFNNYRQEQKIQIVSKELESIYKKITSLSEMTTMADMYKFSLSKKDLLDFGVYPETLKVRTASNTTSAFGVMDIGYLGSDGFAVTYTQIPPGKVCSKIILSQKLVGWTEVIGSSTSLNFYGGLDVDKITKFCSGNDNIYLQFRMKPYAPLTLQ